LCYFEFFIRDARGSIEPNEIVAINSKDSSIPLLLGENVEDTEEAGR